MSNPAGWFKDPKLQHEGAASLSNDAQSCIVGCYREAAERIGRDAESAAQAGAAVRLQAQLSAVQAEAQGLRAELQARLMHHPGCCVAVHPLCETRAACIAPQSTGCELHVQAAKAAAESAQRNAASAAADASDTTARLCRGLAALAGALREAASLVLRCCAALEAAAAMFAAPEPLLGIGSATKVPTGPFWAPH